MSSGFTLTETIITIAVFVLVVGAVMAVTSEGYQMYRFVSDHADAVVEARSGIRTMVREIRQAQEGEDGTYPIEQAGDKEIVFYSDVDGDGEAERVRYFLGSVSSDNSTTKDCVSFEDGGSCSVVFSDFYSGTLEDATLTFAAEGDLGWTQETAGINVDGSNEDTLCQGGQCNDCRGDWGDSTSADVTSAADDNSLTVTADASASVNDFCDWEDPNHSLKAQFTLSWTAAKTSGDGMLKKGVTQPQSSPTVYPSAEETVSIVSRFVRNAPPIFTYYDKDGNELETTPARLSDTKSIGVFLVVDEDPNSEPKPVEVQSRSFMRNL